MGHNTNFISYNWKIEKMRVIFKLKEILKYNNRKIKAKSHLVSKVCPSKPVGEKGKGRKGEKRKERREKGKKMVEQGGRCDFFLLLQAFQVLYKW